MSTTTKGLRHFRLARALSQDELARRAKVERSRLSRAERGYVELHREERCRLARALGIKLADLTSREVES